MIALLRIAHLAFAVLAALAPLAHVLELPNKLALSGPLWLAVQQQLYRGWGPFLGGPAEMGALATSLALIAVRWPDGAARRATEVAVFAYAGMIAVFFALNAPVNHAVAGWTAATLPADWTDARRRWELGHAIAAVLAVIGLVAAIRGRLTERDQRRSRRR